MLSVCLSACLLLVLLLLHLGHAGSRQGTCGAMAVMFKSPVWGQSVAEGLSSGMGAEPLSWGQGALPSQAEPEPPAVLPWPHALGVSR